MLHNGHSSNPFSLMYKNNGLKHMFFLLNKLDYLEVNFGAAAPYSLCVNPKRKQPTIRLTHCEGNPYNFHIVYAMIRATI